MPYMKEDEIVINGKNVSSSASDVDDTDESFFENKVWLTMNGKRKDITVCIGVILFALLCVGYRFFFFGCAVFLFT